jgi:DNA replication protein DnaC
MRLADKAVRNVGADLDAYHEAKWGGEMFECKFCGAEQTWPGMCEACEERQVADQLTVEGKLANLGVLASMVSCSWENFEMPKGAMARQIEEVKRWRGRPPLLVFSGIPGTGKTHMAVSAVRYRIEEKGPGGVLWISDAEIGARLKAGFRNGEMPIEDAMRNARLLVVDDLGQSYQTPWIAETVMPIICRRHDDGKPTILTTNLTHKDIEALDVRLASRLHEALTVSTRELADQRKDSFSPGGDTKVGTHDIIGEP